jgi:hypothetical protein
MKVRCSCGRVALVATPRRRGEAIGNRGWKVRLHHHQCTRCWKKLLDHVRLSSIFPLNDDLLYQQLAELRKIYRDATVGSLLVILCRIAIDELATHGETIALTQFEPWLSQEKARLAWMDRTRN